MGYQNATNLWGPADLIVDQDVNNGGYTTIQAAINAAVGPTNIFIKPGYYAENISLKGDVNLTSWPTDNDSVIIFGTTSFISGGTVNLSGIQFRANSSLGTLCVFISGSNATFMNFFGCQFTGSSGNICNNSNSSASSVINFFGCQLTAGSPWTFLIGTFTGTMNYDSCVIDGATTTTSTSTNGTINLRNTQINHQITLNTAATLNINSSYFNRSGLVFLVVNSGCTANVANTYINTGTSIVASVAGTLNAQNCILDSSNVNTVSGAGTFREGNCVYPTTRNPVTTTLTRQLQTVTQVNNGGTGVITTTAYGVLCGGTTATGVFQNAGAGTSGQTLRSNGASALPTWGTLGIAGGGTNLTTTPTNGQLLIGNGTGYTLSTLTASTGISITNAAGSITIASTGGGYTWTVVTGTTQTIAINNGYICGNAALITYTLPSTAAVGSMFIVQGRDAGGWRIAQNAGQQIIVGSTLSTAGVSGSVSSTNRYDSITLVCVTANTTFAVQAGVGVYSVV